jgi:PAS domain S-box-containing protein
MDTDRNLLFGVLALQADLIDTSQFVEACSVWATRKSVHLADVLMDRGWILPGDKEHLEYLLERKLKKHHGDFKASLATVDDNVKRSLAALGDAEIDRSLTELPQPDDRVLTMTVEHVPEPHERYARKRLHATGGIGRIWYAHDRELGRGVALKELRPERADNAALWNRFLKEARITGQLEHPGIVPVYELARRPDNAQPFYTMRFVKGRTLSEATRSYHTKRALGQSEPLEFLTLLNAFVTVCNTVGYAHSRGVLHRDLKGQNVILGDFGEVVLLDWGLAKLVDQRDANSDTPSIVLDQSDSSEVDLTQHGQAIGTPAYMAPEQAAGQLDQIDERTDIYGLGAILYEILTGQAPFAGSDTREVLRRVQELEPPSPRQLCPDVPPPLEAACLRALAKQATNRHSAAIELAQDVQSWQEVERRKAEDALRESEALYHSLVETLPLQVWRKDLHSRFTFANQRFCEAVGRPLEKVIATTDNDFYPAELAEKYRRDDQYVIATGKIFDATEEHVGPNGEKLHVQVVKTPIRDWRGEITGTQGVFWDITELKRAEEELRRSRERFELAVQGSQDGLWDWELTTDTVYYSPRYKAMLGYEDHEFPNRSDEWAKRVHPEDIDRVRNELRTHFKGSESLSWIEFRFRHKDGSYRWIRSRAFVLRDAAGRVYRMAGSHEDITDQKTAEEELHKTRKQLDETMAELARAHQQLKELSNSPK